MRKSIALVVVVVSGLLGTMQPALSSLQPGEVPPQLEAWRAWVAARNPDLECPFRHDRHVARQCAWPGRISLTVDRGGLQFSQHWQTYRASFVAIPGSNRHWPDEVFVDGKRVPVIERDGVPQVYLQPGSQRLSGSIRWQRRPEFIQVPPVTGLLRLQLDGERIDAPLFDDSGKLWFGKRDPAASPDTDKLDRETVRVFRRLIDEIPLQLETVLQLEISGAHREIRLGRLLLDGFLPMQLDSALPARIEDDGSLRLQVRPGNWQLRLLARASGQPSAFAIRPDGKIWPAEEVWSFDARHALRSVTLSGVPGIEPSRTAMPQAWQHLPAYLLRSEDRLQIEQQQRGDPTPAPDQLTLQRRLWLDSDGRGYTIEDRISGQFNRARRLVMQAGYELGRAELDGRPQLITRLESAAAAGIEVPPGQHEIVAISRLAGDAPEPGASGWQADFQQASAELQLPPAWSLFSADGVDQARPSILSRWSLWDIFLVLIIGAAFARLYSAATGAFALLTVVLSYHAPNAPVLAWLNLAAVLALLKLVPGSRVRNLLEIWRNLSFLALVLMLVPFAVDEVRQGIYPQLEKPWQQVRSPEPREPVPVAPETAQELAVMEDRAVPMMAKRLQRSEETDAASGSYQRPVEENYQPGALIQTGPGLPRWSWNRVQISWNGPLLADESFSLQLLGPVTNRALHFLRVLLFAVLLLWLLRASYRVQGRWDWRASPGILLLVALGVLAPPEAVRAEFPPAELLQELEQRLQTAPDCAPQCASLQAAALELDGDRLQLTLEWHATERVSVPVPIQRSGWQPRELQLRRPGAGKDGSLWIRRDDGQLAMLIGPGRQELLLRGSLAGIDQLNLVFPLRPHRMTVHAPGWEVSGADEGRLLGEALLLRRIEQAPQVDEPDTLSPDPAPAFVRVERSLNLGDEWRLRTTVRRQAPASGAIALEIPLLDGESVTSAGTQVRDGRVAVNLGAQQNAVAWVSLLDRSPELRLRAAEDAPWSETWSLRHDGRWHVRSEGIPPIKSAGPQAALQTWRPWPGEVLTLHVQQPAALPGATRTIEALELLHTPGQRAADSVLALTMRASQGGDYEFALPAGALLQQVVVRGQEQALPQARDRVRVALTPGEQRIEVHWQAPGSVGLRTTTPAPELGLPLANIDLQLRMPRDRWLLFTGGPAIGPAVLYWGVLTIIVLLALALGRARQLPLKTWHWLLLGAGMITTQTIPMAVFVVAWFFAMQRRGQMQGALSPARFNLMQLGLGLLTLIAVGSLAASVPAGLLGTPDMQIVGNGSTTNQLHWYQDYGEQQLVQAWVISVPMLVYRLAMLAWSLWIAFALMGWLRWGWSCFSEGGLWRRRLAVSGGDRDGAVAVQARTQPEQAPGDDREPS